MDYVYALIRTETEETTPFAQSDTLLFKDIKEAEKEMTKKLYERFDNPEEMSENDDYTEGDHYFLSKNDYGDQVELSIVKRRIY